MAMVTSTKPGPSSGSSGEKARHMFSNGFVERHDLEQYFWTTTTVHKLKSALSRDPNLCCLATPSLAHAFHVEEPKQEVRLLDIDTRFSYLPGFRFWDIRRPEPKQEVRLLDIDTRFSYLPGFRFWDIRRPEPLGESETFRVVVFDPPFFYIPMAELYRAVLEVCKGDTKAKLLIGFLVREQATLLEIFKEFGLVRTKFGLEYAMVKSNKWRNYALYSNVDLPGIKRIRKP